MGPLDLADIEELGVKQRQQRDKIENAPKDKAIKASGKAHKAGNITDREHIENLKNVIISSIEYSKKFEDMRNPLNWGSNIGALGLRAIDAAIPKTPQELQAELVELKAAGAAYPALKLAKEIPIVKKGLGKLDEATINLRKNLLASIKGDQILPDGTIVKKGSQPLMSESMDPLGTPRTKPDILVRSELGVQLGFKRQADGQFVFSWDQLKKGSKKLGNASYWRRKGSTYFTSPPNKADFTKYRNANIDAFMDEWEPYLKLDPMYESRKQFKRYIELHHITPLTISAPLFDNLVPHSDEYVQLFNKLKENFLTPGDMEKNFFLTLKRPHQLLHDKFYVDTIGKQGEKFFNLKRMELINSGPEGRLAVAEEYIKTIKDGEGIIKDAMNYLSLVYRTNKKIPPEELVEQLTKIPYSPKYRLRDMDKMVRGIIEQYDVKKTLFKPKPTTKPKDIVKEQSDANLIKEGLDILDTRRADRLNKRSRSRKKSNNTDQGKLDI